MSLTSRGCGAAADRARLGLRVAPGMSDTLSGSHSSRSAGAGPLGSVCNALHTAITIKQSGVHEFVMQDQIQSYSLVLCYPAFMQAVQEV